MSKLYAVYFKAVVEGRCMVTADSEEEAEEEASWNDVDVWENPNHGEIESIHCLGYDDPDEEKVADVMES